MGWKSILNDLFSRLKSDAVQISPSNKSKTPAALKEAFSQKVSELEQHKAKVEYGDHIQGMYDIEGGEPAKFDGMRLK